MGGRRPITPGGRSLQHRPALTWSGAADSMRLTPARYQPPYKICTSDFPPHVVCNEDWTLNTTHKGFQAGGSTMHQPGWHCGRARLMNSRRLPYAFSSHTDNLPAAIAAFGADQAF
jgi:hypothetical protein